MSIPACWWYCDEYVSIKRYLKTKLGRFGPTEMGSSLLRELLPWKLRWSCSSSRDQTESARMINWLWAPNLVVSPPVLSSCVDNPEILNSETGWSLRLAQVSFWRLYLHSSSIFALCHWTAGHLDSQCHIGIGGLFYQLLGSTCIWLVHVQHCSASILCGDVEWAEHC